MTNLENLKQIKASFETLSKEYKEIKGQMEKMDTDMKKEKMNPEMMEEMMKKMGDMKSMMDEKMERMMENMGSRMGYMEDEMYEHANPSHHLPPINSPSQMANCLKALGMDQDYTVKPRTIFANTKRGLVVEAAYTKES